MSHWWRKEEVHLETKEYELGQLLTYEQPTPYIVESTKYSDKYKTPVLTAGKSFIIGYTNEETGIYDSLPVIIFDDFTTSSQYVNFKFKVKSSAMKILTANAELVLPKYIFYRMQIINFDHSTHKRYWIQHYSKLKVPIPSLDKQHYIVSRIEELFSELEKGVETLQTIKQQLAVYRQAVLKEAFEGDFNRCQLKEISTTISGYAFKSKKYTPNGEYTVVKIGNVKQWHFDFSRDFTKTNEVDDSILNKYLLKQGDCLITLTGSRGKRDYGFVAMVDNESNFLLNQRVAALRFNKEVALPKFFMYYLASFDYRNQFFSYETGNVGQGNVGVKALSEPVVVCPPLKIQYQVVAEIESRLSVCDSIEQTVDTALTQAEAMRQSILKKAFEGGFSE